MGLVGCIEAEGDGMEPRAAPDSTECRVELVDSFNLFTTILDVESSKEKGALFFTVIDEDLDETIDAQFDSRNSPLETDVSVPDDTLNQIRARYRSSITTFETADVVEVDDQLTYTLLPGADCTRDEFALIRFFVDEWLYFG